MLKILQRKRPAVEEPAVPYGIRVYAIGDVHGCLDLLNRLLVAIEADIDKRLPAQNRIIVLGDLIDRGPDSAGVIERLRTFSKAGTTLTVLCGNHEEVLLDLLDGDDHLLAQWLHFGGKETIESYGLDPIRVEEAPEEDRLALVQASIPQHHQSFLRTLVNTAEIGDYLFVHAGIRPGMSLAIQLPRDLRWIREPFLSSRTNHGFVVVHGHTINDQIVKQPNRIGLDTGAYATGRLSALGAEGTNQWFLEAVDEDGLIAPASAQTN